MRGLFSFVEQLYAALGPYQLLTFHILAALSVPSVLLRRSGRPTSALAWLFSLFLVPGLGPLLWWAFGRTRMERRLRSQEQRRAGFVAKKARRLEAGRDGDCPTFVSWLPARAFENHACVTRKNEVELLMDGRVIFERIEQTIDNATRCVHFLFYSFELDETGRRIVEVLIKKARQGLVVRVLVDGFGSSKTTRKLRALLTPHGVQFAVFLPSRLSPLSAPRFNFINHRKIIVVDEQLAFCGGMNIGDQYRTQWHDMMLEIRGAGVVGLSHILLEDWYFATQEMVDDPEPSSRVARTNTELAVVASGPDTEPWIHDAYFTAMTQAKNRLYFATPYFIPTPSILTALRTAKGRGVDVRIVLPSRSDVELVTWASRSFYSALVRAGVRIYEYDHTMIHAKALLIDEDIVSVGTANVDNRSFRLNFEVSCFARDQKLGRQLELWLQEHMEKSTEITAEYLMGKGVVVRLIESAAHLLSPLL